jgi:hypothetical protein
MADFVMLTGMRAIATDGRVHAFLTRFHRAHIGTKNPGLYHLTGLFVA